MNIFARYAARSMKKNHTRTRITWIGMILTMALFTAVIEGAYSCVSWLKNTVKAADGSFEAVYHAQNMEDAQAVEDNKDVKESLTLNINGWAKIPSGNEYKPYLLIESGDLDSSLLKVTLTSGHLPENENEIILPENLKIYMDDAYELGQSITLDVGQRTGNGKVLSDLESYEESGTESITDTSTKTYTVVGYYQRLATQAEDLSCPGFTAFTKGGDAIGANVYVTLKNIHHLASFMKSVPDEGLLTLHSDLTRYDEPALGGMSDNLLAMIRGLAAILIGLVMIGSISLIYNAFAISVSERQKEYGLLKSIGASRGQIRSTVLYEALITGVSGIIPGIAVGLLGTGITLHLMDRTLTSMRSTEAPHISLAISWKGLLLASAICLVTVLIASWIPARRAIKVTPMDAIRQKDDVKINARTLRTPRYVRKLFGLEGVLTSRNFRRSHKRFRATILSLSISVILFISASSFSLYMNKASQMQYGNNPYDISVQMVNSNGVDAGSVNDAYNAMKSCGDVSEGMYETSAMPYQLMIDPSLLTTDALKQTSTDGSLAPLLSSHFAFLDDDSFRQILKDNHLEEAEYFNTDKPLGLFYNTELAMTDSGKSTEFQVVKSSGNFTVYNRAVKAVDGMTFSTTDTVNGVEYAVYYDNDYMQSVSQENGELDPAKAKKIPLEQSEILIPFNIGAVISKCAVYESIGRGNYAVLYPMSMFDTITKMNEADSLYTDASSVWMQFVSKDHANTAKIMADTASQMSTKLMVTDMTASSQQEKSFIFMISALGYAFITLIALIVTANIFNTISTNLQLRRKEFAMLRSVGMTLKSFRKMLYQECLLYGVRSLIISIPVSILVTYGIYRAVYNEMNIGFIISWKAILIACIAIFASVGAAMLYGGRKLARENLVEALRNENA
ncbi:MAG: FtsX-like permease family protein [Lactimicrobium sp.]|jgi:putative ABC transport system permease protein|uniref:FtsX-like permease family protein n=1 Tax=Lactimicrobium sp. TaxID=2563780 RepID=UPI002F3605EC